LDLHDAIENLRDAWADDDEKMTKLDFLEHDAAIDGYLFGPALQYLSVAPHR
jgi:hypothetical protein